MLRIGRTLACALVRRYEDTLGLAGLPVIRLGDRLRAVRWTLLELARIDRLGRDADSDVDATGHGTSEHDDQPVVRPVPAARHDRVEQLQLLPPF